jgi:hypothetical protein
MGVNIELAKAAERVVFQLKKSGRIPKWTPNELGLMPAYDLFREDPKEFERLASLPLPKRKAHLKWTTD